MRQLYYFLSIIFICLLSFKYAQGNHYCVLQIKESGTRLEAKKPEAVIGLKSQSSFQKDSIDNSPAFRHVLKNTTLGAVLSFKRLERQRHTALISDSDFKPYAFLAYDYITNFLYPKHVFW